MQVDPRLDGSQTCLSGGVRGTNSLLCRDEQTSADVSNTASFGLPPDAGPGGAGGACTNAMMLSLSKFFASAFVRACSCRFSLFVCVGAAKNPSPTWIELLDDMRGVLAQKGFTQIPQLSSSREVLLTSTFDLKKEGRTKVRRCGDPNISQRM